MKGITQILQLIGLATVCFLLWKLTTKPVIQPKQEIIYRYDTTIYQIKVDVPRPVVSLPQPPPQAVVDTQAILEQFFQIHYYRDTIADTNITAVISDSVGYNRILFRDFTYRITRPDKVIVQEVERKPLGFSLGAMSHFDTVASFGLMVGVRLKEWEVIGGRNLTDRKYFIGVKKEF